MTRARPLALLLAALVAAPAAADDVAEARQHYREGVKLYRDGKYRAAIGEFEAAYRKKPHGNIQFNLAQCREKLGEWPAALRGYHDYLREVPEARDRASVLANVQRLEERLATTGVQVLLVYSEPLGAEVRIDGKPRGTTPFHIVLSPGDYDVTVARTGYAPAARRLVLGARGSQVIDERLRPVEAAPVPLPPPPVASAPASTVPPPAAAAAPPRDLSVRPPSAPAPAQAKLPPPPERPAARGRLWTWVAAGAGAVALGAAAYYGNDARAKSNELRDGKSRAGADALADQARTSQKRANVLYGVAGAAGAAGVTLFFVEGRF